MSDLLANRFPWETKISETYLRLVLGSFMHDDIRKQRHDAVLKFGNQGDGKQPNYQISTPDGKVVRFSGASKEKHAEFHEDPREPYNEGHLYDDDFMYSDIEAMLGRKVNL